MIKTVAYEFVRGAWRASEICEVDEAGEPRWRDVVHPPPVAYRPSFAVLPTKPCAGQPETQSPIVGALIAMLTQ